MKKLLIATHNIAKIKEIKVGLKPLTEKNIRLVTLSEMKINSEAEETGFTFKENAILKAKYFAKLTDLPTVADDGGLVIPYLNNGPGVKSKRWLGYDASDEELIQYTLKRLELANKSDRTAYLQTCICFYYSKFNNDSGQARMTEKMLKLTSQRSEQVQHDKDVIIYEEEKIKGHIAEKPSPRRVPGFPYRALLIVDKFNKYYDELTEQEHEAINHRLKALRRLVKRIDKYLLE